MDIIFSESQTIRIPFHHLYMNSGGKNLKGEVMLELGRGRGLPTSDACSDEKNAKRYLRQEHLKQRKIRVQGQFVRTQYRREGTQKRLEAMEALKASKKSTSGTWQTRGGHVVH